MEEQAWVKEWLLQKLQPGDQIVDYSLQLRHAKWKVISGTLGKIWIISSSIVGNSISNIILMLIS